MGSQQAEVKNEKPKKTASFKLLIGGAFCSVLWIVGYIFVASLSAPCLECDVTNQELVGWWASHVTCLHLNEIGDALAGFAAPLAFFWFLIAVFLQKEELENSRDELRLSREAAEEQVKNQREANATALNNLEIQYRLQWMSRWQEAYDAADTIIGRTTQSAGEALSDQLMNVARSNSSFAAMLGDEYVSDWFKRIGTDQFDILASIRGLKAEHEEARRRNNATGGKAQQEVDVAFQELEAARQTAREARLAIVQEDIRQHISRTYLRSPGKA